MAIKRLTVELYCICSCGAGCEVRSPTIGATWICNKCQSVFRVSAQSRTMTDKKSVGSFIVEVLP